MHVGSSFAQRLTEWGLPDQVASAAAAAGESSGNLQMSTLRPPRPAECWPLSGAWPWYSNKSARAAAGAPFLFSLNSVPFYLCLHFFIPLTMFQVQIYSKLLRFTESTKFKTFNISFIFVFLLGESTARGHHLHCSRWPSLFEAQLTPNHPQLGSP